MKLLNYCVDPTEILQVNVLVNCSHFFSLNHELGQRGGTLIRRHDLGRTYLHHPSKSAIKGFECEHEECRIERGTSSSCAKDGFHDGVFTFSMIQSLIGTNIFNPLIYICSTGAHIFFLYISSLFELFIGQSTSIYFFRTMKTNNVKILKTFSFVRYNT